MDDQLDTDLIAAYIVRYTQHIQWVSWWLDATDDDAGDGLRSVLFEPGTEALRDLTAPGVRQAVVEAVLASPRLCRAVGAEADRIFDAVAGHPAGGAEP